MNRVYPPDSREAFEPVFKMLDMRTSQRCKNKTKKKQREKETRLGWWCTCRKTANKNTLAKRTADSSKGISKEKMYQGNEEVDRNAVQCVPSGL